MLAIHFVIVYLIPCIINIIATKNNYIVDYGYNIPTPIFLVNLVSTCFVYILLVYLFPLHKVLSHKKFEGVINKFGPIYSWVLVIFLLMGILFLLNSSNNFRYEENDATYSKLILTTIILRSVIEFLVIFDVISYFNDGKFIIFGRNKYIKYILVISLYITSHGIFPLLTSFLINILYFFLPGSKLIGRRNNSTLSKLSKKVLYVLILVIGIPSVYLVGWTIKTNSFNNAVKHFYNLKEIDNTIVYFINRLSVHYISCNTASEETFSSTQTRKVLRENMFQTLKFRIWKLTGFGNTKSRPIVTNTSRYNFETTMYYDKNISKASVGASAGVLGSLSYVSSYPLCSIFAGTYLYLIFGIVGLLKRNKIPSLQFLIIIWFLLRGFRANPGDFINVFDANASLFIIYCLVMIICIKRQ